jgi:hypothetical protein
MSVSSPAVFMSLHNKASIDLVQNFQLVYKIRSRKLLRSKSPRLFILALDLVQN